MKVCSKCSELKQESEYYTKDAKSGRLHAQSKLCYARLRKKIYTEHYKKYGDQYREHAKARRHKLRTIYRDNMLAYLNKHHCAICGEHDIRTLELDHIDPKTKKFSISQAVRLGYSWEQIEQEIEKCRVLCANCHKKHAAEQAGWYKQ